MRFLTAILCCCLSGCSLLFVSSPPERVTAYTTLNCTTGRAAPALDAIGTAIQGVTVGYYANAVADPDPLYVGVGLAWLGVFAVSTIYGFSVVSSCNDAHEERDRLAERETPQRRHNPWEQY